MESNRGLMSKLAWGYICIFLLAGISITVVAWQSYEPAQVDWLVTFLLVILAILGQLLTTEAQVYQRYHPR